MSAKRNVVTRTSNHAKETLVKVKTVS